MTRVHGTDDNTSVGGDIRKSLDVGGELTVGGVSVAVSVDPCRLQDLAASVADLYGRGPWFESSSAHRR